MLCLSRKLNERILIGGGITVTVLAIGQGRVRLGITAPDHIAVCRPEAKQKSPNHQQRKEQPCPHPA